MKISTILIFTSLLIGCESITPEQVDKVHKIYHVLTGEVCVFGK